VLLGVTRYRWAMGEPEEAGTTASKSTSGPQATTRDPRRRMVIASVSLPSIANSSFGGLRSSRRQARHARDEALQIVTRSPSWFKVLWVNLDPGTVFWIST